ncbi:hypothetical protein BAU15_05270 [Enterococcus sp. JM4C]|uniref:WDGH domain-containing protein n=1 Tax=Candidatus Enterococcus huntleyi TaxID=1857217 RepID=UPI00192A6824|nr:hypothetical protein [Enterococcus sp. JM4C]KAF1295163.1 hypothetical protein BAU15_05270 [Enterococcus sp. JM4C]
MNGINLAGELNGAIRKLREEDLIVTGDISDTHHTFDELYEHRCFLFAVICNLFPRKAWKSLHHSDGTMYEGMFIVGIDTPEGTYSYHYEMEQWSLFTVPEWDRAPEWDGHKPKDIDRLFSLLKQED